MLEGYVTFFARCMQVYGLEEVVHGLRNACCWRVGFTCWWWIGGSVRDAVDACNVVLIDNRLDLEGKDNPHHPFFISCSILKLQLQYSVLSQVTQPNTNHVG